MGEIIDTHFSFLLKIFGVCLFLGTLLLLLGLFINNLQSTQQQLLYAFSGIFYIFAIVLIGIILAVYVRRNNIKEHTTVLGTGKGALEHEQILFSLPRRKGRFYEE